MQFAMKFFALLLLPLGALSAPVDVSTIIFTFIETLRSEVLTPSQASAGSLGVRNPAAYDTQPAQGSWGSSGQQSGQGGDNDGDEGYGGKSGGSQGGSSGGSSGSSSDGSNADVGTVLKDLGIALKSLL